MASAAWNLPARIFLKSLKYPLRGRITDQVLRTSSVTRCQIRENGGLSYYQGASDQPLVGITVAEMLEEAVNKNSNKIAVIDCEQNLRKTYSEYMTDIEKLAAGLMSLGMQKGDRLGIWSPNSYQWVVTQYACALTGVILVCVNYLFQPKELGAYIKFTGVKTLIAGENVREIPLYKVLQFMLPNLSQSQSGKFKSEKFPDLENVIMIAENNYPGTFRFNDVLNFGKTEDYAAVSRSKSSIQIHDPVHMCFTSGTTGSPKAVPCLQHAITNGVHSQFPTLKLPEDGILCNCTPLFHALGLAVASYGVTLNGLTAVFPSAVYSPTKNLEAIKKEKCNIILGTPTMYADMMNQPNFNKSDVASITTGMASGAPLPTHLLQKIKENFVNCEFFTGYGATETNVGFVVQNRVNESVVGTVGKVTAHVEVKVVDKDGNLVPWNSPGEILCRGYMVTPGYWKEPEKTKAVMTADNFYKTGDIGCMSDDGVVTILGRISDIINRGGEKIHPAVVEEHLATHPNILEAHVFGVPDERLGENVCAWVLLSKGDTLTSDEVVAHCEGKIAKFQIPQHMKFVYEVPRFPNGKANKLVMKQQMVESKN